MMQRLQDIQEFFRQELSGFVASAIVDTSDGIVLAGLAASSDMDLAIPIEYYTKTFRSALRSFESVGWGQPIEVLVPGPTHTVVLFSINDGSYYQGIAVESMVPMGLMRALFRKMKDELESVL